MNGDELWGELLPEFYDPRWIMDFAGFRGWLGKSRFVGMDGFNEMIMAWVAPYSEWTYDIERIVGGRDDRVAVLARQRGQLLDSASWVEMDYGFVYTLAQGVIQRLDVYASHAETLEAAGLSE